MKEYFGIQLDENHENEQYFFTLETASNLATLLKHHESPCCLCTPTVYQILQKPKSVLMDIDRRVLEQQANSVYFDMNRSIFRQYVNGNWHSYYELCNTFDAIIVDPPFDLIPLELLAFQIAHLLDYNALNSKVYLIHQKSRAPKIKQVFEEIAGLTTYINNIDLVYQSKRKHISTRKPVVLFELTPNI